MLTHFAMSVVAGIGLAILLTQKGDIWPVKYPRIMTQRIMHLFHHKWPQSFYCVTCCAFWSTLFCQIVINALYALNNFAFMSQYNYAMTWPISGFAACGIVFLIYQLFNSIAKSKHITLS